MFPLWSREKERGAGQQLTLFPSQIKNEEDDTEGYKLPSLLVNYGDEKVKQNRYP